MRGCRPAGPLTALLLRHPLCPARAWLSWAGRAWLKGESRDAGLTESSLLSGPFLVGSATRSHTQSFPGGKEPPHRLISPEKLCGLQLKAQEKGSRGSQRVLVAPTRVRGKTATEGRSLRDSTLTATRGVCSRSTFHPAAFLGQKVFLAGTQNSHTTQISPSSNSHLCPQTLAAAGPSEVPQKQRAQHGAVGKRGPHRLQGVPGLGDRRGVALQGD